MPTAYVAPITCSVNVVILTLTNTKNKPQIIPLYCNFLLIIQLVDKPECKKCAKVLQELENIDDEADQLGIGFVKINDENLAEEYNLGSLPSLVYYRHQTPIIYEGIKNQIQQLKTILLA